LISRATNHRDVALVVAHPDYRGPDSTDRVAGSKVVGKVAFFRVVRGDDPIGPIYFLISDRAAARRQPTESNKT
jgi:hypothetical protein